MEEELEEIGFCKKLFETIKKNVFSHKHASKKVVASMFVSVEQLENVKKIPNVTPIHCLILVLCALYIVLLCIRFCFNLERNDFLIRESGKNWTSEGGK